MAYRPVHRRASVSRLSLSSSRKTAAEVTEPMWADALQLRSPDHAFIRVGSQATHPGRSRQAMLDQAFVERDGFLLRMEDFE